MCNYIAKGHKRKTVCEESEKEKSKKSRREISSSSSSSESEFENKKRRRIHKSNKITKIHEKYKDDENTNDSSDDSE